MQLQIEPDSAIPLPKDNSDIDNFRERTDAAVKTAELLELDTTPTDEDKAIAEQAVYDLAENEPQASKALTKKASTYKPATYHEVKSLLDEFSVRVVDSAVQIRLLVTNKLLLESGNDDPKIRIRALELLGKITDVGLFTEKTEVTINQQSTQDLTASLRAKIRRLMLPDEVEDVVVNGETIDLDEELGLTKVEVKLEEVKFDDE
jgi:hypothetical protein